MPSRPLLRARVTLLGSLLAVATSAGCAAPPVAGSDTAVAVTSAATTAPASAPSVAVEGRDLVLVDADGTRTTVASVEDRTEVVEAAARPGDHAGVTVLVLTRTEGRYELRYTTVTDGQATDLYWFPLRLQVAADTVEVSDVPPRPVWAPDGSAVAWLEWDAEQVVLRTVGWFDHDLGTNPSDDQTTTPVDLPAGSQLTGWEPAADGTSVLTATRPDGATVRLPVRLAGDDLELVDTVA